MLLHHRCTNRNLKKVSFKTQKEKAHESAVIDLCVYAFSVSFPLFYSLLHLSASVAHTCFISHSSGLVSSSPAFDHWLVRELACAFTSQNWLKPCDTEKPARTNPLPGSWDNSSLLILLKQLSIIVDLVSVRVKCCCCSSGCRFSHRTDGVLDKDHHSWRQEITGLLRL